MPLHAKITNLGFSTRSDTNWAVQSHRSRLEAYNFGIQKKRNCTIRVAKTMPLISCAVTAPLFLQMQIVIVFLVT